MEIKTTEIGITEDGMSAFYNDGITPLPKGFSGDCELTPMVRMIVYPDKFRFVKNGEQISNLKELGREVIEVYLSPLPAPESKEANRDWDEDFNHENGNYQCHCGVCGNYFIGHKRRVRCKVCAAIPAPQQLKEPAIDEGVIKELAATTYPKYGDDGILDTNSFIQRKAFISGYTAALSSKSKQVPVEEVVKLIEDWSSPAVTPGLKKLINQIHQLTN
jgi:hypothetical protein